MKKHSFTIVALPYAEWSGGIMALHELCEALNQNGHQCGMIFIIEGSAQKQDFKYTVSNHPSLYRKGGNYHFYKDQNELATTLNEGTIIYPDLIVGNPLNAKRTIRFVLNHNPSTLNGDFILGFSKQYSKYANFSLFKPFHHPSFHNSGTSHWTQRTLDLTYIGKGSDFVPCHRIPNTILVERNYPRDKEQLALLLRQCRFFYTWDNITATNLDAIMCGAIPIFLHNKQQLTLEQINQMEHGPMPIIPFESIDNLPDSLQQYDIQKVDSTIKEFKQKYHYYNSTWVQRVSEFSDYYTNLLTTNPSFNRENIITS